MGCWRGLEWKIDGEGERPFLFPVQQAFRNPRMNLRYLGRAARYFIPPPLMHPKSPRLISPQGLLIPHSTARTLAVKFDIFSLDGPGMGHDMTASQPFSFPTEAHVPQGER